MSRATEERAWAAGFFDGEGGTYFHKPVSKWRGSIVVKVGQTNPFVLERMREALGVGTIHGPMNKGPKHRKLVWVWDVGNTADSRRVLELMWPWLSPEKKAQAERAIALFENQPPPRTGLGINTLHCIHGHPWGDDVFIENGKRRCGICRRDYARERYALRRGKDYKPLVAARGKRRA